MALGTKRFNIISCLAALIGTLVGVAGLIALFTGQGFGLVENWEGMENGGDFEWLQVSATEAIFGTSDLTADTFAINGVPLLPIGFYLFLAAAILSLIILVLELIKVRGLLTRLFSLVSLLAFVASAIIFFVARVTIPSDGTETSVDFINTCVTLGGGFLTAAACGAIGGFTSLITLAIS